MDRDLPKHAAKFASDSKELNLKPSSAMHIECFNIAGYYSSLSSLHANVILRTEANIIKAAFAKQDIDAKLYHTGGGKFIALIPSAEQVDGTYLEISDEAKQAAQDAIKQEISALNILNMRKFFAEKKIDNIGDFDNNATLGDVIHPKNDQQKGIDAVFTEVQLDANIHAGSQILELRKAAEQLAKISKNALYSGLTDRKHDGKLQDQTIEQSLNGGRS